VGRMIEFARPDGKTAPGYYVAPETNGESAPGIVLVEEWWGVTAWIMEVADRYATLGYRVLVPDLFRGRTAAIGDEANHLVEGLDFQDALSQDVLGALRYLKQSSKKAGVTGYCMGGAIALLAAMHLKEPDAAVIFYGLPPEQAGNPATIEIPIQLHYGRHDEFFKAVAIEKLEERLKAGKVPYELYWYDAKHGFCNPNPPGAAGLGNYNSEACSQAWERTVQFWQQHLQKQKQEA
jgi:carboxymethylenebutenolidase